MSSGGSMVSAAMLPAWRKMSGPPSAQVSTASACGNAKGAVGGAAEPDPRFDDAVVFEPQKSGAHCEREVAGPPAELSEPRPPAVIKQGQADLAQELVRFQGRRERGHKIFVGSDALLPAAADNDELGIECGGHQAPFGGRIGVSDASTESAPRSDRKMPNMPRHPRQKRGERTTGNGRFETSVPGQRANAQLTPVLAHIIECLD